ncbi:hypothetical protein Plhal703r1_c25g0106561 [Plasmopara halstedii]
MYNPAFYGSKNKYLTLQEEANLLFCGLYDPMLTNNLDGTPGIAKAGKRLVFDSSINITGINAITVTGFISYGSNITASGTISVYTNLTSPAASIGSLDVSSLSLSGTALNLSIISGITPGAASPSKAVILDSATNITGINQIGTSQLKLGSNCLLK